jgi:thymidylate synthase (FAD)
VVKPDTIENTVPSSQAFDHLISTIADDYTVMRYLDVPNEDARYILPNACTTSLYMSCNLRELIHLANERLCTRAQWEIQELVRKMCDLVDEQLQFMLVPKCQSGRIICNSPCGKKK